MSRTGGDQQAPPQGGAPATNASSSPLDHRLGDDETVVYRLQGASTIDFESEDGEQFESPGSESIALITDRRVYLAGVEDTSLDVSAVRYRNVRDVEAAEGLLRRHLDVRVWDEGTYRFKPARGEPVADAGEFVERASGVWQRVLAAVENAREAIDSLGARIETGDEAAAAEAREAVRRELETARDRIAEGPAEIQDALTERVQEAETELHRTQVHANLKRGQALYEAAEMRADEETWSEAEAVLQGAYHHVEVARKVAALAGFPVLDAIDEEFDLLVQRAADIAARPRKLAGLAEVTARDADEPEEAVPAWSSALEHYRAAVTFDWGGRLGVERDTERLREQVEAAARCLIDARRELAEKLCEKATEAEQAGEPETAADHYEAALSQLAMAHSVASELRAGDPDAITAEGREIRDRMLAVGGPVGD